MLGVYTFKEVEPYGQHPLYHRSVVACDDTVIGYRRVYEIFYELGERIEVVPQPDATFRMINGRKRTWMARTMGITRLPVCVLPRGE